MEHDFGSFSKSQWMKFLMEPDTQAFISKLRKLDEAGMENAAKMAASGDTKGAQEILSAYLKDPEVSALAEKLRKQHG